jgi:hypothetical protein
VCKTQNDWGSALCPSSGILNTRKHKFSENESISFLKWEEGGDNYSVVPLERANFHVRANLLVQWLLGLSNDPTQYMFLSSPEEGNRSSARNVMVSIIKNPGRWTSPETQWLWFLWEDLHKTATLIPSTVRSFGLCCWRNSRVVGFLWVLWFPLPISILPTTTQSSIILSSTPYSPYTDSVVK